MTNFLIPSTHQVGDRATLSNEEARHLGVVLRKRAGDEIRLTDGKGSLFRSTIESLSKKSAVVLIQEKLPAPKSSGQLLLAPSLLKGDKMEFVLQKAVELGVDAFLPFTASRTVAEWKKGRDKITRWRKISEAASKQCGRATHMRVEEPVTLENLTYKIEADVKIIFWEESDRSVRDFFHGIKKSPLAPLFQRGGGGISVAVIIGPEGGFPRNEVDLAVRRGFAPLSLGSVVLRADTAAIAAMSLIQYELGNI